MVRAVLFLTGGLQPGKEMFFDSLSTKKGGMFSCGLPSCLLSLGLYPGLGLTEASRECCGIELLAGQMSGRMSKCVGLGSSTSGTNFGVQT